MDQLNAVINSLDEESFRQAMKDPVVKRIYEATECIDSHDLEHHWPFNVDRGEERPDCIYCGKTKRQVMAAVVGVRGNAPRKTRRSKPVPEPGKPPEFKDSGDWEE